MANFKINSRYTNGIVSTDRNNLKFLLLRNKLKLDKASTDTYVTISQEDTLRPDLISFKAYNTYDLWWVILEYNNISDPCFELQINQILIVPEINRVLEAIKNLGKV
jgi:hypothetical protein